MHKSLSIVIPVYNEEHYLRACLDAIARQTVKPSQVIVVDNNSSDGTVKVAKQYPFVTLLREKQQGIVYARNTGFNAVDADIIGRIDADTIMPADWVERVLKFYSIASNHDHALTGGGYFYNVRFPRLNGWIHGQFAYRLDRLIVGHYVLWGTNMALPVDAWRLVRKEACVRTDTHEDFDLSFHLHDNGIKITYQESLRVGASLVRIYADRRALRAYMRKWPRTLRSHNFKLWWLGIVGNWFLWYVIQPLIYVVEFTAHMLGRPSLFK